LSPNWMPRDWVGFYFKYEVEIHTPWLLHLRELGLFVWFSVDFPEQWVTVFFLFDSSFAISSLDCQVCFEFADEWSHYEKFFTLALSFAELVPLIIMLRVIPLIINFPLSISCLNDSCPSSESWCSKKERRYQLLNLVNAL
jgi:hypothetical protein